MKYFFKTIKSVEMLDPSETEPNKDIELVLANFYNHFKQYRFLQCWQQPKQEDLHAEA